MPEPMPAPSPAAADAAAPTEGGVAPVLLGRHVEIFPDRPIPELSRPATPAFAARSAQSDARMFALLADPRRPPRIDALTALYQVFASSLLRPAEWGAVRWPGVSGWRYALVYERPRGICVMPDLNSEIVPLTADRLTRRVVSSLIDALQACHGAKFTHGGVRPNNLFYLDGQDHRVILGDGAAGPPNADQPAIFLPTELAMADPAARGEGGFAADLYALGVTLVFLAIGRHPLPGLNDRQLLDLKLGEGSYVALTGRHRIPTVIKDALRGLLDDDPVSRWSLATLTKWRDGTTTREARPRASVGVRKTADRPFAFAGRECRTPRELAHVLAINWDTAIKQLDTLDIADWTELRLGDAVRAQHLRDQLNSLKTTRGHHGARDAALTRVATVLDPRGPLRYRGISFMFDGLGSLLAERYDDEAFRTNLVDIFEESFHEMYLDLPGADTAFVAVINTQLNKVAKFAARREYGTGIEYALYALNPYLPCLSPLLSEGHCVILPEHLITALDEIAAADPHASRLIDRHIAAFLAARVDGEPSPDLALTEYLHGEGRRATIRALMRAQRRAGIPRVENLARWMANFARSTVNDLHNRQLKAYIEGQIDQVAATGNLAKLAQLLDNDTLRRNDDIQYRQILASAQATRVELERLGRERPSLSRIAHVSGQKYAGTISAIFAVAAVVGAIVTRFF